MCVHLVLPSQRSGLWLSAGQGGRARAGSVCVCVRVCVLVCVCECTCVYVQACAPLTSLGVVATD